MALLFIDGCENSVVTSKWTQSNGTVNFASTDGVISGTGAISFPAGATGANQLFKRIKQTKVADGSDNANITTRTSFWFKCTETITSEAIFMQWREYYNFDTAVVAIGTDGKLKISNWYRSTRTYNSVTNMSRIDDNAWHFLEFSQFYTNTSSGLIEVYVDGNLKLRVTGSNIGSGAAVPSLVGDFFIGGLINGTLYIDDLVIWDEASYPDAYKGRKGPVKIYTIRPSADTSYANSTPSSGSTRFNLINENITNLSNLVNSGVNTTDLYEFTNMPEVGIEGQIYAVTTSIVYSSAVDGFRSNLKMILSDSNYNFTKGNTFSSFTSNIANGDTYTSAFVTDTWSANTVNSFKLGFEVLR